METKRFKNYITWKNKQGEFNTECNRASLETDLSLTIPTTDMTKVALGNERERVIYGYENSHLLSVCDLWGSQEKMRELYEK